MMTMPIINEEKIKDGISEYDKFRNAATEAIARCQKAEEEVAYTKGEMDAIRQTCAALEARNRALMEENAEYKILLSDLGRRFLDVLQDSRLSPFRAPGSIEKKSNSLPPRTRAPDPYEKTLREMEEQIVEGLKKG